MNSVNVDEGQIFYIVVGEGCIAVRAMVVGGMLFMDSEIKDVQLNNKMARLALNLQESNLKLRKNLDMIGNESLGGDVDFDSEGGSHD